MLALVGLRRPNGARLGVAYLAFVDTDVLVGDRCYDRPRCEVGGHADVLLLSYVWSKRYSGPCVAEHQWSTYRYAEPSVGIRYAHGCGTGNFLYNMN